MPGNHLKSVLKVLTSSSFLFFHVVPECLIFLWVNTHSSSDARQPDQLRRDLCHAARGGRRGHFGGGGRGAGDGALHLPGWLGGSMGRKGSIALQLQIVCSWVYLIIPQTVCPQCGKGQGRCLIEVLTLGTGIFLLNFRMKWLLRVVHVRFDCAGSPKTCVALLGRGIFPVNFRMKWLL